MNTLLNSVYRRIVLSLVFVLVALLASGCYGVRQELTVWNDDSFEMLTTVEIPESVLSIAGRGDFEKQLDQQAQKGVEQGATTTWRIADTARSGFVTYVLTTKSNNMQALTAEGFTVSETTYGKDNVWVIDHPSFYADFTDYSLVVHGDKILESNGRLSDDGSSVTFTLSSDAMHVVVKPKSRLNLFLIGAVAVGVILLGVVLYFLVFGGRRRDAVD